LRQPKQFNLPFRHVPESPPAAIEIDGRSWPIEFVRHRRARHYILRVTDAGSLRLTVPRGGSRAEALAFVATRHAWIARESQRIARVSSERLPPHAEAQLRRQADVELRPRLAELAAEHGLAVTRVSIRGQRSRWGSCSPSGTISLNWRLAQLPPAVRDYVLIHELAHLRHLNHSARFWKEVARMCPGYTEARAWLRARHRLGTP